MADYAIGIDLGGTKIAGALITRQGDVVAKVRQPTQVQEGVQAVIERVVDCVQSLMAKANKPVAGIGIGVAGATDCQRGVIVAASNLKWSNVPLRDLVAERLAAKQTGHDWTQRIWMDKDTNAAVLGEMLYGAGQGADHLLYVMVGTGVGGGMILDGRLYHGANDAASDIGHLVMEADGPLCGCGKRGCLETLASGTAIARQARQALRDGKQSRLSSLDVTKITAIEVVAAAKQGDELARNVMTNAGVYLGIALAYYIDINNPELIIIGGGVAAAGDLLFAPIRQIIAERALPRNVMVVKVVPAGLGDHSSEIGAATLVWHHHSAP